MKIFVMISAFVLALMLTGCAAASAETDRASITCGTQTQRGFVNDNIYHSKLGDIHYSSCRACPMLKSISLLCWT